VGVGVLVVLVAALVAWVVLGEDDEVTGEAAAQALLADYTRSLDATYRIEGEFTRTMPDERELSSGLLVVQRPPDRLQRSLGSTSGVVGGRLVNCGPSGEGGAYDCAPGALAEPFEARRAQQLEGLEQYVTGDGRVYDVVAHGDRCYELRGRRFEPTASFGLGAELCFDGPTGALRRLQVEREGGAVDELLGVVVTGTVTDADFDLSADDTYDPQGPTGG
jgi:hypothetical protein